MSALLLSLLLNAEPTTLVFTVRTGRETAAVHCALFSNEDDWLKKPIARQVAKPVKGLATCTFANVAPGTYATSAYQDIDGDEVFDRNVIGIPEEPVCTSNNVKSLTGPPKWSKAKFEVTPGENRKSCRF